MTAVAHGEEAVAVLAARWMDLAGRNLAYKVASGEVCDRCARNALTTIGVAGGLPPKAIATQALGEYGRVLADVSARVAALLEIDRTVES